MSRCQAQLSGLASCHQSTYGRRACFYHRGLLAGCISVHPFTLQAVRAGSEGDRVRSPAYATALRIARSEAAETNRIAALRDYRRELETLLLLAVAGAVAAWIPPVLPQNVHTANISPEQRKSPRRRPIRVWRSV